MEEEEEEENCSVSDEATSLLPKTYNMSCLRAFFPVILGWEW
jgi:hypothetical protein